MPTERIKIGDQSLEIEVAPITLIVKAPSVIHDVQSDERVFIDCYTTVRHAEESPDAHPMTERLFKIVFPEYTLPVLPSNMRREGMGAKHVFGLIDLSLRHIDAGTKIGWRYPESYLHPKCQCDLADVLIELIRYAGIKNVDLTL